MFVSFDHEMLEGDFRFEISRSAKSKRDLESNDQEFLIGESDAKSCLQIKTASEQLVS